MKIYNTHAKNSGKKPKPAAFCGPEFIEVHNFLVFLVTLIYQWNKVIDEVRKVWFWNVSPSNVAKLVFRL